ncbi:MAG: hypothetical protein ABSB22_18065 [Thermodesulfobacteriota bacterium]|jgi:hypothetical protein
MRNYVVFSFLSLFLLTGAIDAQTQLPFQRDFMEEPNFPEVPRVSAYEAYIKYKSGKAIIIQAGGELYERRHILGAFNVDGSGVVSKGKKLPNFPKSGVEIFIYCY